MLTNMIPVASSGRTDDVKTLAVPVLAHRVIVSGLYGRSAKCEDLVREALSGVIAPDETGERA